MIFFLVVDLINCIGIVYEHVDHIIGGAWCAQNQRDEAIGSFSLDTV